MMNEFLMIFRNANMPTQEQMMSSVKLWQDWIGSIAAQDKFVSTNSLGFTGKTLKADGSITDGPYAEIKEFVGGYLIVKTNTIDEALKLAKGCPILAFGGTVEVRDVMKFN